jgi:hypothetical protein
MDRYAEKGGERAILVLGGMQQQQQQGEIIIESG